MPEYIERSELLEDIAESVVHTVRVGYPSPEVRGANKVIDRIKSAPVADVVEVKRGEWKEHFAYDCWHYDCPFCDFGFATKIRQEETPNYCENCGAKMDLEEGAEK